MALQKLKATKGGGEYEIPPAGAHQAVLVAIIDLGTQTTSFQGKEMETPKILFVWELDEQDSDGENFIIHRDYSQFFSDRSNLRAMAEGWRGKPYADDEEFDFASVIGKPCQVNVKHGLTSKKKEYAEVAGVMPLGKKAAPFKPTHKPFLWEIKAGAALPDHDWIPYLFGSPVVEVIKKSKEWKELATAERDDKDASADDADPFPDKDETTFE